MAKKLPPRIVRVDGGRVTSRSAATLSPNEVRRSDNAEYRPNDPRLWSCPGRAAFSAAESGPVIGGAFLQFENTPDLILIRTEDLIRSAGIALTGTFATRASGLQLAAGVDSVYFEGEYFLLDGVNRNRVVTDGASVSVHGMLYNSAAPALARDGGAATGFVLGSGKKIYYWIEERVKNASGVVVRRSAEIGTTLATLTGDGSTDKPRITRPGLQPSTTHWALFATETDGVFPIGNEVAEVAAATTFIDDDRTGTNPGPPSGADYEQFSVNEAGVVQAYAKFGEPPVATTGDVFENSIVLNDVSNRGAVVFSHYGQPHAFPASNVMRVGDTKFSDEVTLIRRVGKTLLIGCKDSIWRVPRIPRADDQSFDPQLAREQVHDHHGIAGPLGADTFDFGEGLRLAYVSRYGVHVTDSRQWDAVSDDMDWENEVELERVEQFVLRNDPARYRLVLFYTPKGGTRNTKAMYLYYHPSHAKSTSDESGGGNLRLKMSGPRDCAFGVRNAFLATINAKRRLLLCGEDGVLYVHDEGNVDEDGEVPSYVVETGEIFPAGVLRETNQKELAVHHAATPGETLNVSAITRARKRKDDVRTRTVGLEREELGSVFHELTYESVVLGVSRTSAASAGDPVAVDFFALDIEPTDDVEGAHG